VRDIKMFHFYLVLHGIRKAFEKVLPLISENNSMPLVRIPVRFHHGMTGKHHDNQASLLV
jgi:hypothetical protein